MAQEQLDASGTRRTIEAEYTIPVPVLGKLAESLTVRRNDRNLQFSLLNVKETLEAVPRAPRRPERTFGPLR